MCPTAGPLAGNGRTLRPERSGSRPPLAGQCRRRFRHLVPGSAEVAERLGDDDAGLGAQPIQDLDLWVKLPQLGHVGGVEQDLVRPSLE